MKLEVTLDEFPEELVGLLLVARMRDLGPMFG